MEAARDMTAEITTDRCVGILIVEDTRAIREILEEALTMEGYRVTTAANGKIALDKLSKMQGPTLILLDLMLPVVDGWEFLKAERARFAQAKHRVIVVSAVADSTSPSGFSAPAGVDAVIRKPISLNHLMTKVRQYCDPLPSAASS